MLKAGLCIVRTLASLRNILRRRWSPQGENDEFPGHAWCL